MNDDLLDKFKEQFVRDYSNAEQQRKAANEDYRFAVTDGGQWEEFNELSYENRAKYQFDLVGDYKNRFMGEWASNRVEPKFSPDDNKTSKDDAEMIQGIYRRDYRKGNGRISLDNAVDDVALCGMGAVLLMPQYEDDSDPEDERQMVTFEQINNAYSTVAWDSASRKIDKSDATRVTYLEQMDKEDFLEKYPDMDAASAHVPDDKRHFNWNTNDVVHIAHRWEAKKKRVTALIYLNVEENDVAVYYDDEDFKLIKNDIENSGWVLDRKKKINRTVIEYSIYSGNGFIQKPKRISGEYLPVVPFYGYRGYVDGQEFYSGIVRKRKDAQRLMNMLVSQVGEVAHDAASRVPIIDPKAISGFENVWSNSKDYKWLPLRNVVDEDGKTQPGLHGYLEPNTVDPNTTQLLDFVSQYLRESTGGMPADFSEVDASGKAIRSLLKRLDANTKPIMDNIAVGLRRLGQVYLSMAGEIYDMEREIKTVGFDGSERSVSLKKVAVDEKTGMPKVINDITKMKFEVVVETGAEFETLREETVETIRSLVTEVQSSNPNSEYIPVLMASLIDNIDAIGLDALTDFNHKQMLKLGLVKPESEEDQAYVQSLSQQDPQQQAMMQLQLQSMQAQLQKLQSEIQEKSAKAQETAVKTEGQRIENQIMLAQAMADTEPEVRINVNS